MKSVEILSILLIVIGAIINFILPQIIKKVSAQCDETQNKIYITKSIGLVLVVIGCIIFFWLGGKFGV